MRVKQVFFRPKPMTHTISLRSGAAKTRAGFARNFSKRQLRQLITDRVCTNSIMDVFTTVGHGVSIAYFLSIFSIISLKENYRVIGLPLEKTEPRSPMKNNGNPQIKKSNPQAGWQSCLRS